MDAYFIDSHNKNIILRVNLLDHLLEENEVNSRESITKLMIYN